MALNGPLDPETRDNLNRSHAASKVKILLYFQNLPDVNHAFRTSYSRSMICWYAQLMISIPRPILYFQDLARLESGNQTSFNQPFDLCSAVEEAAYSYRHEAERRNIGFNLDVVRCPHMVVGDAKKIRTVVQNLTANARKYLFSSLPYILT